MKEYIYPKDLKMSASLLLWQLQDAVILFCTALFGLILFGTLKTVFPLVAAAVYGVLTIDLGNGRIYDYIKFSVRFFGGQRIYFWRL